VILKADGVPFERLTQFVEQKDPQLGESRLPWIDHLFFDSGTLLTHFYTRGISLSAPAWSMLDTGQHLRIKGNVEFNRFANRYYDYPNFFLLYLRFAAGRQVDMPGVELLDLFGIPLLADAYPFEKRHIGFQLFQRGTRLKTFQRSLQKMVFPGSPRRLIDEWSLGFEGSSVVWGEMEREFLAALKSPEVQYLDFFTPQFDHISHLNRNRETQLTALKALDQLLGRIWTGIQQSPLARTTVLILVSDHGTNTDEQIYSQGYNLIELLNSPRGGGHHVLTRRPPLAEYSFKSLSPAVPMIVTPSPASFYLSNLADSYPTAFIDLDGNERASIYLRNANLNLLHMLWRELAKGGLPPREQAAMRQASFELIARNQPEWGKMVQELEAERRAIRDKVPAFPPLVPFQGKKWTPEEISRGLDQESLRRRLLQEDWQNLEQGYARVQAMYEKLLQLASRPWEPGQQKLEDFILPRMLGPRNSVSQLMQYPVGLKPKGVRLEADGKLDWKASFEFVNYYQLMAELAVRNNPQPGVNPRPIDWIAARIPREVLDSAPGFDLGAEEDPIWLFSDELHQALILARHPPGQNLELKYLPVIGAFHPQTQTVHWTPSPWKDGLPLKLWEDLAIKFPGGASRAWLSDWHDEIDWLQALHQSVYSNGLISLHEQSANHSLPGPVSGSSQDQLKSRFLARIQRDMEPDFAVFARNHWNFNAFSFNPGGNHGGFFQLSTRAILMFVGGDSTGIPRGKIIERPYDTLSFIPTVFALTKQWKEGQLSPDLRARGFAPFPGRVIQELIP
jgi:hypothetical protein